MIISKPLIIRVDTETLQRIIFPFVASGYALVHRHRVLTSFEYLFLFSPYIFPLYFNRRWPRPVVSTSANSYSGSDQRFMLVNRIRWEHDSEIRLAMKSQTTETICWNFDGFRKWRHTYFWRWSLYYKSNRLFDKCNHLIWLRRL